MATAHRSDTRNAEYEAADSLVERLYRDIEEEGVVVFTGAGSTTERKLHNHTSFYELILKELALTDEQNYSFPALMQIYCDRLDGGNHNRLLRRAIEYLELFFVPGELQRSAARTPHLLATIPYLKQFITTNWDPLLERALDVLTPVIDDRDLGFWSDKRKQVLKIHGCITRPYSVVATEEDYRSCLSSTPLIFNKLRDLLATKTCLFIGYSMRDDDFREIWNSIVTAQGRFAKLAYAIDPHSRDEDIDYWAAKGIAVFRTADVTFLNQLKSKLEGYGLIPTDELLAHFEEERERLVQVHLRNAQTSDGGMASSMYQDGLLHGLSDVLNSSFLGSKRNQDFQAEYTTTNQILRRAEEKEDIFEIAYWSGQSEVLRRFCERDMTAIPSYFHPYRFVPVRRFVRGNVWTE